MTTPKVRVAWPIGFTPGDVQRAQAGPRGPQDPVTISTGNVIGVYDDDPGEGTWHYRIGYPSQASPPVYGPWAAILVAIPVETTFPLGAWEEAGETPTQRGSRNWTIWTLGGWFAYPSAYRLDGDASTFDVVAPQGVTSLGLESDPFLRWGDASGVQWGDTNKNGMVDRLPDGTMFDPERTRWTRPVGIIPFAKWQASLTSASS